jgi:hypothetical protein
MAKVKTPARPRIRELKHQLFVKTLNRKKNLDGCNAKNTKYSNTH